MVAEHIGLCLQPEITEYKPGKSRDSARELAWPNSRDCKWYEKKLSNKSMAE